MAAQYLTAIFFDAGGKPYKYHNIKNSDYHRTKFENFAVADHKAVAVNYYLKRLPHQKKGTFLFQQKLSVLKL